MPQEGRNAYSGRQAAKNSLPTPVVAQATQTEALGSLVGDDQLLELLYQCLGGISLGGPRSRQPQATPPGKQRSTAVPREGEEPPEGELGGETGI